MTKNTIGQFIAALRKANGLTQQDVADRLNVSNKAVSRWERDECAPDISLIPPLAELLGVTCDELLKGQRIPESPTPERREPKVEKQVKALINRTVSGFKTLICIAFALAIVGLVCMFGISYGFYRPVIGFAVMMLFEVCAGLLTALAVSKARDVKEYNELFELADPLLVRKYNDALGGLSFTAFFCVLSALLFSLPLVLVNPASDYLNSVLSMESYFLYFFFGVVLVLILIWVKARGKYIAWVTGEPVSKPAATVSKRTVRMTLVQTGLTVLAGIIFLFAPYLDREPYVSSPLYTWAVLFGLACLLGNVIAFPVFILTERESRKNLLLPGIRNILFIPSALIASEMHGVSWIDRGMFGGYDRYDFWNPEYLGYAIALAAAVAIVFALLEVAAKRRKTASK